MIITALTNNLLINARHRSSLHHARLSTSEPSVAEDCGVKRRVELNRHCFGSALDFLKRPEFLAAAHSCKKWYALARMSISRRELFIVKHDSASEILDNLLKSPLKHHVTRLDFTQMNHLQFASLLALVSGALPHVVELSCSVDNYTNPLYYTWPSQLTFLELTCIATEETTCTAFLETVVRNCTSLQSLCFRYSSKKNLSANGVALLKELPKLSNLEMRGPLDTDGVMIIRGLPHLKKLFIRKMDTYLDDLCCEDQVTKVRALPHIEEIVNHITLGTEIVQYFVKLHTLTALNCSFTCADVAEQVLKSLPNLVILDMNHNYQGLADEDKSAEQIFNEQCGEVRALRYCPQLRELTLYQGVDSIDLVGALERLPNLETLSICLNEKLTSLQFLNAAKTVIKDFSLLYCASIPVIEFGYIKQMCKLERLSIISSFVGPLDEFTIATATPHGRWYDTQSLPRMTSFKYSYDANY